MFVPSLLLDLGVLAIIIGCAFFYRRKGFVACIVGVLGALLSLLGSLALSQWVAPFLFNTLFRNRMIGAATDVISQYGVTTVDQLLEQITSFLPQFVQDKMVLDAGSSYAQVSGEMASTIVDNVIAPVMIPIITVFLFLIFFLVLRLLVGLIHRAFRGLNRVPVLGGVNRALGFVAGTFVGLLYSFLLIFVIWILDAAYGANQFGLLYFGNSIVYKLVQNINLLA